MKISDVHQKDGELSADIDGFRLWFRSPAVRGVAGDALVSVALLAAMRAGQALELHGCTCSPRLLKNLGTLQEIFTLWFPEYSRVSVHAEFNLPASEEPSGRPIMSFFSGGADGMFTLIRQREAITHLVSVHGFDVPAGDYDAWSEVESANRQVAELFGVPLVSVHTNLREWSNARVPWEPYHGAALAAVAHVLGPARAYLAASHTYGELLPWGSHPLTDPLWSSERTKIVHDGAVRRSQKLRQIGQHPEALRLLRVCWQNKGYNCGECEKCVRTRTTLTLLGLHTPSLPPISDPAQIARQEIGGWSDETFVLDNLALAKELGHEPIQRALMARLRRYDAGRDPGVLGRVVGGATRLVRRFNQREK